MWNKKYQRREEEKRKDFHAWDENKDSHFLNDKGANDLFSLGSCLFRVSQLEFGLINTRQMGFLLRKGKIVSPFLPSHMPFILLHGILTLRHGLKFLKHFARLSANHFIVIISANINQWPPVQMLLKNSTMSLSSPSKNNP